MSFVTVKEENGEDDRSESLDQSKKKKFKCKECSKTFAYPYLLKNHELTHLNEGSIVCSICKKGFNSRSSLKKHMVQSHIGIRRYGCNLCSKRFLHKGHLDVHLNKHKGIKNFICSICKKAFVQKGTLKIHMNIIHLGIKSHKCQFCGLEFYQKCDLIRHERIHTQEKPFKCCICMYRFTRDHSLKKHLRTHIKYPPFHCVLCKTNFGEQNDIINHLYYQHCKEKDEYKCKICPSVFFNTSQKLDYHNQLCHYEQAGDGTEISLEHQLPDSTTLGIEDEGTNLQCCQLEFSSIQQLKIHIRHHYREISPNEDISSTTTICNMDPDIDNHNSSQVRPIKREIEDNIVTTQDETMPNLDENDIQIPELLNQASNINLIDEVEEIKVKREPLIKNIGKCTLCNEAFADAAKLKSHFKLEHFGNRAFACAKCRKTFSKASLLGDHSKLHQKEFNPRTYACKICCQQYDNVEDLRRDFTKHLGKPYSCNCGYNFRKAKQLLKHCKKNVCSDQTNTFSCTICSKLFDDTEDLKIHVLEHFGNAFFCAVCNEDFTLCQDLEKHVKDKHEKPFFCNLCGKNLTLSIDLTKHVREKHTIKYPYACILCDQRVSTINLLKMHNSKEHELRK